MSFIDSNLSSGERVVYRARLHWTTFVGAINLAILGLIFLSFGVMAAAWALWTLAALFGVFAMIRYLTSEFGVTDRRVLAKVGVIRRSSVDLLLGQVESVRVRQGILGRLLGYGTVVVVGSGGSTSVFPHISRPLRLRRHVNDQIAAREERQPGPVEGVKE